jgi:HEAT repeat protein
VQGKIVSALGQTMSQRAVEPLISVLSGDDLELQTKAANSLKQIKSEKTVELLICALNDNDYRVRELAADTLGSIKSRKAVGSLTNALKDADPRVQKQAENSLKEINSHEEGVESIIKSIIESINDENFRLTWRRAEKIEQIKSEEAVDPLIKALKHKKSDVRFVVARSLGQIKSKKAVGPLIEILNDKERWVRIYTAHALGNIKSEKAVEPLIKTLYDEDYSLRHAAAEALRNCCNLQNKIQLDELLKSDYIFVRNTAFEILYEIEKKEKSKNVLFNRKTPYREDKVKGENYSRVEHVRPAEEGIKDAYFGIFVDKLKSIKEPTTIVDYGCGEGKFICALTTLPENAFRHISYFGVDISTRCRYISRLTAEKYGLTKKLKNEPEFLKPEVFSKKDITVDYIFFMHVLHEVRLVYLVDIIYSLSSKVKYGGKIFILDQKELVEEERSFVLWDDEKDFEMLFKDSGFKPYVRYFKTGSGKQLSSIEIEKVEDKCFTSEDAGRNCLAVYKAKQAKLMEKRKQSGLSDGEYSEISVQLANIVEQIAEYEITIIQK